MCGFRCWTEADAKGAREFETSGAALTPLARPALLATALERARQRHPLLLTGPPGAGKTTLLHELAGSLAADGLTPLYLDLMGAASSPERFVATALAQLPPGAARREVERLAAIGRPRSAAAVTALFELWARLDQVALLLDEALEIRSLAYFPGLREVDGALIDALAARRAPTLLATSMGALAQERWPALARLEVGPLGPSELPGVDPAIAQAVVSASHGWVRYAQVLLQRLRAGDRLAEAWADEMQLGGRLELLCRHTYESLLLRSRGYGMSKAVLQIVAGEEGLNLTALVPRIGRTPGATRDYLGWLCRVDALVMRKKRYHFVDGMLRRYVLLHTRGVAATVEELKAAAADATQSAAPIAEPEPASAAAEPVAAPLQRRSDTLMEID